MEHTTEAHDTAVAGIEKMFGGGESAEVKKPPEGEQTAGVEQQGAEGEQAIEGQEQAQGAAAEPEEVEVEIEGEKYLVPKKISDRFIQHADYTRKTQDIAEMRKALTAEREVATVNKAFESAVSQEQQQLGVIRAQIDQLRRADWQSMETEQLLKSRALLDQLKDAQASIEESVKAKRADFDTRVAQHMQEAMAAGEKYIAQHIKAFDQKAKKELYEYGVGEGYTREEMEKIADPRIVVTLWKAAQWDRLQASKPGTMQRASQAVPTVKPGAAQRPASRVQALSKGFKEAKGNEAKKQAAINYFAERLAR